MAEELLQSQRVGPHHWVLHSIYPLWTDEKSNQSDVYSELSLRMDGAASGACIKGTRRALIREMASTRWV